MVVVDAGVLEGRQVAGLAQETSNPYYYVDYYSTGRNINLLLRTPHAPSLGGDGGVEGFLGETNIERNRPSKAATSDSVSVQGWEMEG